VVDSGIRADHYLRSHPALRSAITKIAIPYEKSGRFLIFSTGFYRQSPKLAEALWSQIRVIRHSKEFKQLTEQALEQ